MNHKPLIAVDVDEVLAQHNAALAEWHNQAYGTNNTADSFVTDKWEKIWGVTFEEAERRAEEFHATGAHKRMKPVEGSAEALTLLKNHFKPVIITVRRKSIIQTTKDWLSEHFPGIFEEVYFIHYWDEQDRTTKAELCQKLNAHCLIDDSLNNCSQAAGLGIPAYLFGNYTWNQSPELPHGVIRADSWNDILHTLTSDYKP